MRLLLSPLLHGLLLRRLLTHWLITFHFGFSFRLLIISLHSNLIEALLRKWILEDLLTVVELLWVHRKCSSFLLWAFDAAGSIILGKHKWNESDHDWLHTPERVPSFRVVIAKRCANLWVCFEATWGSEHDQARRLHWILGREHNLAVVEAALIITLFQSEYKEMPAKYIFLFWERYKIIEILACLQNPKLLLESENTSATCHF